MRGCVVCSKGVSSKCHFEKETFSQEGATNDRNRGRTTYAAVAVGRAGLGSPAVSLVQALATIHGHECENCRLHKSHVTSMDVKEHGVRKPVSHCPQKSCPQSHATTNYGTYNC